MMNRIARFAAAGLAITACTTAHVMAGPLWSAPARVAMATVQPPSAQDAFALQQEGDFEAAAEAWSEVVESEPDNGAAWFNYAYCTHAAGHPGKAIELHRKAAEFDDFKGIALYNLGCAYALTGRTDAAFEALQRSQAAGFQLRGQMEGDSDLDSLRDDPRYAALLGRNAPQRSTSQGSTSRSRANPADELMMKVQNAIANQMPKIQRAIENLFAAAQGILDDLSDDPQLGPLANMLQERLNDAMAGVGASRRPMARVEQPAPAPATPQRRDTARSSGEHAAAAPSMARAIELQRNEQWEEAAKAFSAVAEADPDNGAAWFGRAYCIHMSGDYEKSIVAHRRASTFDEYEGISLYNLGCAYALTGELDRAFRALRAAHEAGFDVGEHIGEDPDLERVRRDSRYSDLLSDLGLDY